MSVKVTSNAPLVLLTINRSANLFLRFLLDEVDKSAEPITPKKEGELRRGTLKTVSSSRGSIKWAKEYAAAQEVGTIRGYPIKHYTTPGTGKAYARRGVEKAVRNVESIMQRARLI